MNELKWRVSENNKSMSCEWRTVSDVIDGLNYPQLTKLLSTLAALRTFMLSYNNNRSLDTETYPLPTPSRTTPPAIDNYSSQNLHYIRIRSSSFLFIANMFNTVL